ncbi:MAG: hypothetical protein ACLTKE_01290 [Coprococcus sp.]
MQLLFLSNLQALAYARRSKKSANNYIIEAISYIRKNYQNPITVQEVADYLSLNRSYRAELLPKRFISSHNNFY